MGIPSPDMGESTPNSGSETEWGPHGCQGGRLSIPHHTRGWRTANALWREMGSRRERTVYVERLGSICLPFKEEAPRFWRPCSGGPLLCLLNHRRVKGCAWLYAASWHSPRSLIVSSGCHLACFAQPCLFCYHRCLAWDAPPVLFPTGWFFTFFMWVEPV